MTTNSLENALAIWNDQTKLKDIKSMFAPKATDLEFKTYVQMGIATGLNPFLREIWLVKYDEKSPAQIFIGRDGYRKTISRNTNYDYHIVDAVHCNDEFQVDLIEGKVKHIYNIKDRGKLVGAYCLVFMKSSSKPYYVFVPLEEYDQKRSVWNNMKATMIKKVAECQAIRMADSTCFSGTKDPDEMPEEMTKDFETKSNTLNKKLNLSKNSNRTIEGETINQQTGEIIPPPAEEQKEQELSDTPTFTFEEIKAKMENATNLDVLTEAASVISDLQLTQEKTEELRSIYRQRLKEIKGANNG